MHSTNAYPREAATKKHSKFTRPRNENVNATFCFKCTSTISGKFATLRMGKFSAESGRACSHTARCRALPLMPCRGISRCCATTRDVARQRAIMRDARCRATTRGKVTLKSNQVQLQTVTLRWHALPHDMRTTPSKQCVQLHHCRAFSRDDERCRAATPDAWIRLNARHCSVTVVEVWLVQFHRNFAARYR